MHTTWYGQSCSNEAEAFRLLRLSKLNCVVSAETLLVTFKMQVIARFIVNCDNAELNHSHVGAGNVTPTELRLEANRYFSSESTKEGSCSLTSGVSGSEMLEPVFLQKVHILEFSVSLGYINSF